MKKRTVGTVLVGVVEILIGLFFLLMASMMVLIVGRGVQTQLPEATARSLFAFMGAAYSGLGALAIATGIGVFVARNWARIVTLIAGGILGFTGLIAALVMSVFPFPTVPNVSTDQIHMIRIVMACFWVFVASLGVWWLVLFTRPRIVEMFRNQDGGPATQSSRPLSITVLGGIYVFVGVVGLVFPLGYRMPTMLFGQVILGTPANVLKFLFMAINIAIGIGLLRLDRRAYFGALTFFAFGTVNALFTNLLPGRAERFQKLLEASPFYDPHQSAAMPWMFSPWLH